MKKIKNVYHYAAYVLISAYNENILEQTWIEKKVFVYKMFMFISGYILAL